MSKYIDAEKLIAEIERLNKENDRDYDNGLISLDMLAASDSALYKVRDFINSLPEEKPSEDLEKEIERVWDELMQPNFMDFYAFADFAHHFANWQKEQVIGIIEGRIAEILGDAQPAPILRMELDDIIKRIKED